MVKKILAVVAFAAWALVSNMDYEDAVLAHSHHAPVVSDEAWRTGHVAQGELP